MQIHRSVRLDDFFVGSVDVADRGRRSGADGADLFPGAAVFWFDPAHLRILTALRIKIGSVNLPVGFNLFAVSGVTGQPVM